LHRSFAHWRRGLRVKSLLLMRLPDAAEAGIREGRRQFCGGRTVSVKQAKGKGKGTTTKAVKQAKNTAKGSGANAKKPVDMVQVRENINNLVGNSARKIAIEVIKVALTGQLATAKYLFEAVGLYPATEETVPRPIETSLAHTLLKRMGLPLEPVDCDDDDETPAVPSAAKDRATKAIEVADEAADKDPGGEHDEDKPVPAEGEA
jgi:hypothetical protein